MTVTSLGTELPVAPRGLEGVAVSTTSVSDVDGTAGFYHYRGTDPTSFVRTGSFEDAWFLLLNGALPSAEDREAFRAAVFDAMRMPPVLRAALPSLAALGPAGSIDVLRSAVSAAGVAIGCRPWTEQDETTTRQQIERLAALTPVLTAALFRLARGLAIVEPRQDLGFAANYLYMVNGVVPSREQVHALETYLILAADHGFCNSTFAERVIASSGADVGAALSGAIGALSGPLHGGAIDRVPSMLAAIGDASSVERWMKDRLDRGERLMGFGHAVYRTLDPRNTVLRELARSINDPRVALALEVERVGVQLLNDRKADKHREANIELYAGVVLDYAGVPEELFACTFPVARMAGWTANLLEQIADNRIFRPSARYVTGR